MMQQIFAIAVLTWKAAFRFKLFIVLAVLLLAAVVGLPILIKDDGTARGFTQILLTYTLTAITAFLGLSTLWLACGTLARDIEECQIQMVVVKPIARWQIWLGKWLGIMSLNASLLALAGGSVYGLLQWRATRLPPDQQAVLRNEVLVARASVKEESLDKYIETQTDQLLQERLKKNPLSSADVLEVRKQIREQVKAQFQVVPPGGYRPWQINLGLAKNYLRDQPLYLRVKFNAADKSPSGTFTALWQAGVPESQHLWRDQMSLAPETFHEFQIPPNLFDEKGVLTIFFLNPNDTALLFPLDDGMEVLYRQGGFGLNYVRGLGIILCWMALLATLGLASATFLSFPVAAFLSLGILTLVFSSGTISGAVSEGTLMGYDSEAGAPAHTAVDVVAIPVFRALLKLINLAKDFSPIDSLSTGRCITWGQLGQAGAQIILLLCGLLGLIGIFIFNRRELATAQGTQ
ncbi:MAG: ABC transporter permease [Verrucomicrobia bacterium]|nr:ABC transporter permease [Verrucomicrobiota bacterium]